MKSLPNRQTNFADWYQEVFIRQNWSTNRPYVAALSSVLMAMPFGKRIQAELDHRIKMTVMKMLRSLCLFRNHF